MRLPWLFVRALLVVNPRATTTTSGTRDALLAALGSDISVDVAVTTSRGHATELAREARGAGLDALLVLGGDGTVNETVNGLLAPGSDDGPVSAGSDGGPVSTGSDGGPVSTGSDGGPVSTGSDGAPGGTPPAADTLPALGVLPGGSTNVFARALGLPEDPVAAAERVLRALRRGRRHPVGLGRADGRWFTFCAGLGLDAEVIDDVERRRAGGQMLSAGLYLTSALRHFYLGTERRVPALTLEAPGRGTERGLHLALVGNTAPWTYLGSWPVNPWPEASFDSGLDFFALRRLGTLTTLRHVAQILRPDRRGRQAGGRRPHGRHLVLLHDLDSFTVRASRPVSFHVDGEPLGTRRAVRFESVRRALDVLV